MSTPLFEGLEGQLLIVYKQDQAFTAVDLGVFVDEHIANAGSSNVEHPNAWTERVVLDGEKSILYGDQIGQINYTEITAVRRIKVADLPAENKQILRVGIDFQYGFICLPDTLIGTRLYNNIIESQPASAYVAGDVITSGQVTHQLTPSGPQQTQRLIHHSAKIPHVIFPDYGEVAMTRYDAIAYMQVFLDHADEVDPQNYFIVMWAMNENVLYYTLQENEDVTATYDKPYLYYLETAKGGFQTYFGWQFGYFPPNDWNAPSIFEMKKKENEKLKTTQNREKSLDLKKAVVEAKEKLTVSNE